MTTTADLKHLEGPGVRARVQKAGAFLAGMIMPNIGAFIAWGLITMLFIPKGWLPNADLAKLVGPIIIYLLPRRTGSRRSSHNRCTSISVALPDCTVIFCSSATIGWKTEALPPGSFLPNSWT